MFNAAIPGYLQFMFDRPSNAELLPLLAAARYGAHPVICRKCDGHEGVRIDDRTLRCTGCGRINSITAGTLLRRTKIALWCWRDLLDLLLNQRRLPPTCRALARKYGIAVSSAWHMLQRVFDALRSDPLLEGEVLTSVVRCRKRMKPISLLAPERIRALDDAPDRVPLTFRFSGTTVTHLDVGVRGPYPMSKDGGEIALSMGVALGKRHFSLRWSPNWSACYSTVGTRSAPPRPPPIGWVDFAVAHPTRPLKDLDPWLPPPTRR